MSFFRSRPRCPGFDADARNSFRSLATAAVLAGGLLSLAGCGSGGADGPVSGEARGLVTTAAGEPLAGVEVNVYGTTMAGERTSRSATTDEQGRYAVRIPDGVYGVTAEHRTRFNGHQYRFNLHPEDGQTGMRYDAAEGIVKNFTWRISGLRPGQEPGEEGAHTEGNKYYGGYIHVKNQEHGFGGTYRYFPAGSTLEATLTPQGALIDGTSGAPKTFRRPLQEDVTSTINWYLTDVPVGVYSLSARLVRPDGTSEPVLVKKSLDFSGEFAPSVEIGFEPTSSGDLQMEQVTLATEPTPLP